MRSGTYKEHFHFFRGPNQALLHSALLSSPGVIAYIIYSIVYILSYILNKIYQKLCNEYYIPYYYMLGIRHFIQQILCATYQISYIIYYCYCYYY